MEAEELRTRVDEALGSTQLAISERTINEELEDALEEITDDAQVDEKFINRLVKRFKRMSGNVHADVGEENKKYKKQFEEDWKKNHPESSEDDTKKSGDGDEPAWFKAYREQQEAKFKALEEERKQGEQKAKKETVLKQVKEGLNELFESADVEPNKYILRQTLRDIEIPEEDADVDRLVKKMEKAYYKNLKDADLEDGGRPNAKNKPTGNSKIADELWKKKLKREGITKK